LKSRILCLEIDPIRQWPGFRMLCKASSSSVETITEHA
jgi:hypothetical protein